MSAIMMHMKMDLGITNYLYYLISIKIHRLESRLGLEKNNILTITNTIMQGTVWGSLLCTSTVDMLGKISYSTPQTLYTYKGVPIPPLGMVDDIICVTNVENSNTPNRASQIQ